LQNKFEEKIEPLIEDTDIEHIMMMPKEIWRKELKKIVKDKLDNIDQAEDNFM